MKKWSFLLLVVVMVCSFGTAVQAKKAETPGRAMWVWDFNASVSTDDQRDELLKFSKKHGINLLFVNTGGVLPQNPEGFAALIASAHKKGIQIYALDGDASWALKENHDFALSRIQEVLDFNKSHPNSRFDGIQHDVEPYVLPGFFANIDTLGVEYMDLVRKSVDLIDARDSGLKMDYAIPFWYEQADPPVAVNYNGVNKALSYHILDMADSVSVMSYRDSAQGQIDTAMQEVNYAASIGKVAYVGAETNPADGDGIPDFITYYDEGTDYMHSELEKVESYFAGNAGFGGVAIHWYGTYQTMTETPSELPAAN